MLRPLVGICLVGAVLGLRGTAEAQRLPTTVVPEHYDLAFTIDLAHGTFTGTERIRVRLAQPTTSIVLNAVELDFAEVSVEPVGGRAQKATVTLDAARQTALFGVAQPLEAGAADIQARFTGRLNSDLRGFYQSKGANRRYAVTQFESTDARRAFPCFDEPAFKATFDITLVVDRSDSAISNGRLLSDTKGPGKQQHTLRFSTSPKMSSYLVAMAVGDFRCSSGEADDVPIRICATPDKGDLEQIALESAEHILTFYDQYFSIRYPFGKLDVLAVPDFAAGAMENTAAIFFRESDLLADAKTASLATRKNIASVLAHEMSHQWFGDLVTMEWWNDLWLNEGFATWMANHPLAAWKPEWDIPVDEGLENQTALNVDALASTHPVQVAVDSPAQAEEAFDSITYEKGGAVLRMIEQYVGSETFRKGINQYLEKYAYSNATSEDFWNTMTAASGKPVDAILKTFITQPGVPLVEVSLACQGPSTTASLSQRRFFLDPKQADSGATNGKELERWIIPTCLKAAGGEGTTCDVLRDQTLAVTLASDACRPWVFANAGAQGYYRTAYQPEMLGAMARNVESALTPAERLSLIGDEWALVHLGRHSVAEYLTVAAGFANEEHPGVLGVVTGRLRLIDDTLTTATTRPAFKTFVRGLFRPALDRLGMRTSPADSDAQRTLRSVLVEALGTTGDDPTLITDARAAVDSSLNGGASLDSALASSLVKIAAINGDVKLYDALARAADRARSPEEQYRYLGALPLFPQPALIDRALEYSLSSELRTQDIALYLANFFSNPSGRDRAWSFIKEHWTQLAPKLTASSEDSNLVNATGAFCSTAMRDDVRGFFTTHSLPSADRTLQQVLERIDNCIDMREKQTTPFEQWLAGHP